MKPPQVKIQRKTRDSIIAATRDYEGWLANQIPILKADLRAKHEHMAGDPFSFLRATFYRWIQRLPEFCPGVMKAPQVLAVGDLHVENYGTWRDAEGRLVWGINDLDEACPLPYTADLVRLATSAWLAADVDHLNLNRGEACREILEGYTVGISGTGASFVLSEENTWLRKIVTSRERDPVLFWKRFSVLRIESKVPKEVTRQLRESMPEQGLDFRVVHRRAGLGSLGRERYTAIVLWRGGWIARELKRLVPSASTWAADISDPTIYYAEFLQRAVRTPDPFLAVQSGWVCRRLSPYCSRIELSQLARRRDNLKLLRAMGRELANLHLGSPKMIPRIRMDLAHRGPDWLRDAAEVMREATRSEWKAWRKRKI